jgi:hypothetical protein
MFCYFWGFFVILNLSSAFLCRVFFDTRHVRKKYSAKNPLPIKMFVKYSLPSVTRCVCVGRLHIDGRRTRDTAALLQLWRWTMGTDTRQFWAWARDESEVRRDDMGGGNVVARSLGGWRRHWAGRDSGVRAPLP